MNDLLARISDWLSDVTELTGEVWLNTVDNLQVNHIATNTYKRHSKRERTSDFCTYSKGQIKTHLCLG